MRDISCSKAFVKLHKPNIAFLVWCVFPAAGGWLARPLRAMGSTGWVTCYWCEHWGYDLHCPDGPGAPLCGPWLDHLDDYGKPPSPSALEQPMFVVGQLARPLRGNDAVLHYIALFLQDEKRPGRDSRITPAPR